MVIYCLLEFCIDILKLYKIFVFIDSCLVSLVHTTVFRFVLDALSICKLCLSAQELVSYSK